MGIDSQVLRSVHEIFEELLKAILVDDAAVVARCITELESINREYTETVSSIGPSTQESRKRAISDDQFYRLRAKTKSDGCVINYRSLAPIDPKLLETCSMKPRSHIKPLACLEAHCGDCGDTGEATATPQGTSLDMRFPHSTTKERSRRQHSEGGARCANWPKCLAGPAMICSHGASKRYGRSVNA